MVGDRRAKIAAVLLSLWAALLVAPAAAPALGGPDTGGFAAFNLKASHGYSMSVTAFSKAEFTRGQILISLRSRDSFVAYLAPAKVTDTTIDADLGELGRVALEFEPTGERGRAAPRCEPDQWIAYDKGSYVGEFEFLGEEGYTEATVTSVPLELHPYLDLICGGYNVSELFGNRAPGAQLTATVRKGEERVSLEVNQNRPGARVKAQASINEKHRRIRIHRAIGGTYPATAFDFDPKLRSATLTPSAPFSGSAVFRRHAKPANRWTGSLSVDFPGNSNVPLTGARFDAHLRHARLTESQ